MTVGKQLLGRGGGVRMPVPVRPLFCLRSGTSCVKNNVLCPDSNPSSGKPAELARLQNYSRCCKRRVFTQVSPAKHAAVAPLPERWGPSRVDRSHCIPAGNVITVNVFPPTSSSYTRRTARVPARIFKIKPVRFRDFRNTEVTSLFVITLCLFLITLCLLVVILCLL